MKEKVINKLNDLGISILIVEIFGAIKYFETITFQPPEVTSISSSKFISFEGYEISDFIESFNVDLIAGDENVLLQKFSEFKLKRKMKKIDLSENHKWMKYGN